MDGGLAIVLVVIVAVLLGVGWFIWRKRAPGDAAPTIMEKDSANTPASASADKPVSASPADLQKSDALAVLEITDGPDAIMNGKSVGKRIEIRKKRLTIGRNERQVDIQLYSLDQPSSVSRLHCTIEFHDALKCFFITDEGSSSGTKVDGRALSPYKQHSLRNDDQIELGFLDKQGALLRFYSSYTPPERLSVEGGTDVKDTIRQPVDALHAARAATQPIHRDVFLSYSRKDKDKMHIIQEGLAAHGLSIWSDDVLEPGSPSWRRDVQFAIEGAGCVVAVLSPDAKESEWVNEELGYAKIRKVRIFTVLVKGDESNSIPFGLTAMQWIDMRSDYEEGIEDIVHQSAIEQLVTAISEFLGKGQEAL